MKIVIIGPAYPYRGGLAVFNERLARTFAKEGHSVRIETFTLQYPSFLFPGKTQYTESPAPEDLDISRTVSSINPINWIRVGRRIAKEKPDYVVLRYWMSFMAPSFGTIARLIKRNHHTKLCCIIDNLIPHEAHFWDRPMARYFLKPLNNVVAMCHTVEQELRDFTKNKSIVFARHPLSDNFGSLPKREEALEHLGLDPSFSYYLFFGFIRAYKGLDYLLQAFALSGLGQKKVKILIAGEFYENSKPYEDLLDSLNIREDVICKTEFIPDDQVRYYFGACDILVQPYKEATQSGVTQVAYHFSKPMIVTSVGGLPEIVPNGRCGYVVEPDPKEIAQAMLDFHSIGNPDVFREGLEEEKKLYSWSCFTEALLKSDL